MNDLFTATPAWHAAHPGAVGGILAMRGVVNPAGHPALDESVDEIQRDLRARFGGLDRDEMWAVGALPAYTAYFKRFGQRYHVAMQLESVVRKGKPIPRVGALVTAMFAAELRNGILTAGHDLDAVLPPIRLGVGTGAERYAIPRGGEATVKPGDMVMADAQGVLSAVVTGPAAAARIGPETTAVLYTVYAPPGVAASLVETHLAEIEATVRLVAPTAETVVRLTVSGTG